MSEGHGSNPALHAGAMLQEGAGNHVCGPKVKSASAVKHPSVSKAVKLANICGDKLTVSDTEGMQWVVRLGKKDRQEKPLFSQLTFTGEITLFPTSLQPRKSVQGHPAW